MYELPYWEGRDTTDLIAPIKDILSAKFCGDLNKHKGEKDSLSAAKTELQAAKKSLCKLENTLSSKVALKNQTTSSFSSVVRLRLINERKSRYISSQGFENWRQINIDIKNFRGKIPSDEESLIDVLEEYDKKLQPTGMSVPAGNPVRTLWELKGIKWPTQNVAARSETITCSPGLRPL